MYKVFSRLNLLLAASALLLCSSAKAAVDVPPGPVTAYIEGADASFFIVQLSGVPAGYDVSNTTYPSFCVSYFDTESPVGTHPVQLYDSTGPLPSDLQEDYNRINYILNHKQGTGDDVQAAIWFFTDGITSGLTPAAQAMIDDALANGGSFTPGVGQITAVILQALDDPDLQTIIIEVTTPTPQPPTCDDWLTGGGFVFNDGKKCSFGVRGGIRKGAFWGGINYIDHGTKMHVKSTAVTDYLQLSAVTREIHYNVKINGVAGTAIVIVSDNGEPGTHDTFQISLSTGYTAGGELGGTVKPGGGGNIQLHKPKCGSRPQ